jgi:hypothetical protein
MIRFLFIALLTTNFVIGCSKNDDFEDDQPSLKIKRIFIDHEIMPYNFRYKDTLAFTFDANSRVTKFTGNNLYMKYIPYNRETYFYYAGEDDKPIRSIVRTLSTSPRSTVDTVVNEIVYAYDDKNRLTKEDHVNTFNGRVTLTYNYTYTYAQNGNFLRKIIRGDNTTGVIQYDLYNQDSILLDEKKRIVSISRFEYRPGDITNPVTNYDEGLSIYGYFNFSKYLYQLPEISAGGSRNEWTFRFNPGLRRFYSLAGGLDRKEDYDYDFDRNKFPVKILITTTATNTNVEERLTNLISYELY